jgi:hypothetical protein
MIDGALGAYGGYEYQINVSVWLALDMLLARERCTSLTIEPASEEDMAVDLQVDDKIASSTVLLPTTVPLEIQIKRRSKTLAVADFRELVFEFPVKKNRGPPPRMPPISRLRDGERTRYTLITTSQVHRELQGFVVPQVGALSKATSFSKEAVPASVLGRIGIMAEWVPQLVTREIESLLLTTARVPFKNVAACRNALIELVRDRLLGRRDPLLSKNELLSQLARFGGSTSDSAPQFVRPKKFGDVWRAVSSPPFAVILLGPPGVGKTFLAEYVAVMHENEIPAFHVVRNPTIELVREDLRKPGRTLYYLEDPWGRYRALDSGKAWSEELPRLVQENQDHPDKRFLLTSRRSILAESLGDATSHDRLASLVVQLDEYDYDESRRREILRRWMSGSHRWQRDWTEKVEKEILSELRLPQMLSSFASRVRSAAVGSPLDLEALLKASTTEAIGRAVAEFVRSTASEPTAIVLWTFLGTREELNGTLPLDLTVELQSIGENIDLPRLIALLEENDWVHEYGGSLSAHPSVIEGLEAIVTGNPALTRRTLVRFLACLVQHERTALATRLSRALEGRSIPVPADVRDALNAHLRKAVLECPDDEFLGVLGLLAEVGTGDDPFLAFARVLSPRTRDEIAPLSPEVVTTLSKQVDAQALLLRWAKLTLRHHTFWSEEDDLVALIRSLGWNVSETFHDAAVDLLAFNSPSEIALRLALLEQFPDYERLLQAAFDAYDRADDWFEKTGRAEQLEAEECRVDALHSSYVLDKRSDEFLAAETAFGLIVRARREREGYEWIVRHPRREILIDGWAKAIPDGGGVELEPELRDLLSFATGWRRGQVLEAIVRADAVSLVPDVREILVTGASGDLRECWEALATLLDPEQFAVTFGHVLAVASPSRRMLAAYELFASRLRRAGAIDAPTKLASACSRLSRSERNALALAITWSRDEPQTRFPLTPGTRRALLDLTECDDDEVASIAAVTLSAHTQVAHPCLDAFFQSDQKNVRFNSVRALYFSKPPRRDLLLRALDDDYYKVRRLAMYTLADGATQEERLAILCGAADPSGPVREACADLIGRHGWTEAHDILCALLEDVRDIEQGGIRSPFEQNPHFRVAREAAASLLSFGAPLPDDTIRDVFAFVSAGADASKDLVVHRELINLLARHQHEKLAPLFLRLFTSRRRAGGPEFTFPLRYAAYWGWLEHLGHFPEDVSRISAEQFVSASLDSDERIAGPALLILGSHAETTTHDLWKHLDGDPTRRLLLYAGMRMAGRHQEAASMGHTDDPERLVIDALWESGMSEVRWNALLAGNPSAQAWLNAVKLESPLNACLRFTMGSAPNADLASISIVDLRSGEIPKGIPMLGAFHFAGLE